MEKEHLSRKLAVILHADVVGSTSLVQKNETLAHERIQSAFHKFSETIKSYGGITRELRGDALVAEFDRASDAVAAALAFQVSNGELNATLDDVIQPQLRIGISLGEVVIADNTITGAGVVLAQRLEQLADSGGVVVQGSVSETVPARMPFEFESLGEMTLKGFDHPVRAFAARLRPGEELPEPETHATPETAELKRLQVPDKPSIAVLPFTNMSGDPEQEFFSDGISEDIISELSRFHALFIIARNSSFRFRGSDAGIREIGLQLGVQYVVEGSVRRAGNRVRINAQLIEAETEKQIWTERYDRDLEDVFEVQDEVTRSIVAVLPGRIQEDVVDRAARKPTENMKAYELMLQGKAYRDLLSAEGNAAARRCCQKAIELDPRYARAYMYLSDSYIVDGWLGLAGNDEQDLAMRYAREAAHLDSNDVYIQDHLGFAHLSCGLWREAEVQFGKTLSNIVNEAESMAWCGYAYMLMGKFEKARAIVIEAMRLDPLHPPTIDWILGQIYFFEGKYEEVLDLMYGKALLNSLAFAFVTAAHAYLGHQESTQLALQSFISERRNEFNSRGIEIDEDTVSALAGAYKVMWRDPSSWNQLTDGLRLAGLPD
jgi:adenylate cyclase